MAKLRLADLEAPLETVEFPDGTEHPVQRVNGIVMDMWAAWEDRRKAGEDDALQGWTLAAALVPTASEKQIRELTPVQVAAILGVAGGNVERVMATLKNAVGTEREVSDSVPPIPFVPSSSPSPEPRDGVSGT